MSLYDKNVAKGIKPAALFSSRVERLLFILLSAVRTEKHTGT